MRRKQALWRGGCFILGDLHDLISDSADWLTDRILYTFKDITEHKQVGDAPRASESFLQQFVQYMPAVVAMFDTNMRYLATSKRWKEVFRLGDRDLIGLSHYDVFPNIPARWKEAHQQALRGIIQECEEDQFVHQDGTIEFTRWEILPWHDTHGDVGGIILFVEVITDYKRTEQALRESEERFRLLAENAQDVVFRYELSPTPGFSYVSPSIARITGYTPEEYYADPDLILKAVHPQDQALLDRKSLFSGPIILRWIRKDGASIWIELRSTPIYDANINLVAIEGIARDVTERKQMEEQLLRARRLEMVGTVAGRVAHDFANLLGPLLGYPELIKMALPEGHPAIEYCDVMLEVAPEIVEINENLLTLSRRGHFNQEPTDLNRLVEQVVGQMLPRPDSLQIELDLAKDLMVVNGSPSQLLRVISNIFLNAREAMHDIGILTVKTENIYLDKPLIRYNRVEIGEYVRIEVRDIGCGIPTEITDKIFDPLFTTKRADRRRGSGLGLSIVHAVIGDHRGYVDVESQVGEGTVFSIYLPVYREAAGERLSPEVHVQLSCLDLPNQSECGRRRPQGQGHTFASQ